MRRALRGVALVGLISTTGCALVDGISGTPVGTVDAGGPTVDAGGPHRERAGNFLDSITVNRNVDLLFVIDNSGSMIEEQTSLASNFQALVTAMSAIEGGLPDLHIGVVSSDMGAGGFNLGGCVGSGDDGLLQVTPRVMDCIPPTGSYISDIADPTGGRITNYTTTLDETFSCIAKLGTAGCGFEQHLESMKRALDGTHPENAGFLRPSAFLVVVIVADEDDCSASDGGLFDPSDTSLAGPLGPLSSFRCTEFGVTCDEGNVTRNPASYTNCRSRANSPYVYDAMHYADFLYSIKDPSLVYLATIVGPPAPFTVSPDPMTGNPRLDFACSAMAGEAAPAPRFAELGTLFGARAISNTICNSDLTDALNLIAQSISDAVSGVTFSNSCLEGPLYDTNTGVIGYQLDCKVYDVLQLDMPMEMRTELGPCVVNGPRPCFDLVVDDMQCSDTDTHMSISVQREVPVDPNTRVVAECLRP